MARGDILRARLTERIKSSGLTLSVHYPPKRPAPTGASPSTAPLSPLTGIAPVTQVVLVEGDPSKPPVTGVPCLWLDAYASVTSTTNRDRIERLDVGWVQGATVLARVLIEDAALDPTKPYGNTVFTGASYVEFQGGRYRVLAVKPIGPSFGAPITYYVFLQGALKQ